MELKKCACPHCGATVDFDGSKNVFFCTYCGGQIILDDGSQKIIHEENINIKKESTKTINNVAAIQRAKNEGFLNKYKFVLIIAGVIAFAFIISLLIVLNILKNRNTGVYRPESQDVVVVNNHTTAEFLEVVMGKIDEESILIVAEQEVSVLLDIEQEGFIKWNIFKKTQQIKDYGIVQYTVNLHDITKDDVMYDEETNTLTIYVPRAEIHEVVLEPEKREIGDPQNGFLAWGEVKLTQEESATLEAKSIEKIRQTAEETIDKSTIEKATTDALKDLFTAVISNIDNSTKLRIKLD